jgi:hypothetical protein
MASTTSHVAQRRQNTHPPLTTEEILENAAILQAIGDLAASTGIMKLVPNARTRTIAISLGEMPRFFVYMSGNNSGAKTIYNWLKLGNDVQLRWHEVCKVIELGIEPNQPAAQWQHVVHAITTLPRPYEMPPILPAHITHYKQQYTAASAPAAPAQAP